MHPRGSVDVINNKRCILEILPLNRGVTKVTITISANILVIL